MLLGVVPGLWLEVVDVGEDVGVSVIDFAADFDGFLGVEGVVSDAVLAEGVVGDSGEVGGFFGGDESLLCVCHGG